MVSQAPAKPSAAEPASVATAPEDSGETAGSEDVEQENGPADSKSPAPGNPWAALKPEEEEEEDGGHESDGLEEWSDDGLSDSD